MKTVIASAHGKIILIGEHSVVYQKGAIVAPFYQASITVEIRPSNDGITIDSLYHHGPFFTPGAPIEGLQALLRAFFLKYDLPPYNFHITITSTMLSRRGLGSSAAVAKAFTEALFNYFSLPYHRRDLVEFIQISELVYHAKPSGIDMNAILSDDILWYQNGTFTPITLKYPLFLVVADSGEASQTKIAVLEVAEKVKSGDVSVIEAIDRLGNLAKTARHALEGGTLPQFANTLNQAQSELHTIGVNSAKLQSLINQALEHEALAAKLTGGGQGGCMFALFNEYYKCDKFVKLLSEQGVAHTWILKLGH